MTTPLFRDDAYLRDAAATVTAINDRGGVILDQTIFYPTGGGQPGDAGWLVWEGGEAPVATTVKGDAPGEIVHVPAEGAPLPLEGAEVTLRLDWERRHRLMRVHTALHLLSVVIPLPVTGGSISEAKGRLDFDMPEAPEDKQALEDRLNQLIAGDHAVSTEWITDAELEANPGLVKTMSVKPPMGQGRVRLVRIGSGEGTVDLQPCGGTHVASTAEIGPVTLGKVEKKGKQNRRVSLHLA
ncbi:alanyl-tRNA editing protein [Rhodobacteraceae bacterium NNCM2]|nr:alanyl-tRNA editing protein [Coraliihabitans acroporae]